ncbi:DUF2800 domain-containing protein [Selenomonas ruminantium]|uniref:DUF2800 domain-containing protein n=1 Tax=Selenomonas ruminantium TaxID=971 RepID=UPI0026EB7333|nr:DUF2800 domain-containing protein [Selenomonas ruminantium]
MPEVHAMLSASGSHKWLHCPPSAKLEAAIPDKTTSYAEEGTAAHAVAELRLRNFLRTGKVAKKRLKSISIPRQMGEHYDYPVDDEMWEATGRYLDICIEKINAARKASGDAKIMVEQRLDFSTWVPEGFGTGDLVIVSDGGLEVCDLKYGKGVPVDAVGNTQMRLYALGAYNDNYLLYDVSRIRMTIIQPRLDSVSSDELTEKELLEWGETVKPIAQQAYKGEGEKAAGEHCRFCRCREICRELADYMLDSVKTDLTSSDLRADEIADIVLKSKEIKKWLTDIEDYALAKAIEGQKWPGLKVVAGRSSRKLSDPALASGILLQEGYAEADIYKPQELHTLTTLEKIVGKKKLSELLKDVIVKPQGKPTLAAESDKRPPMELDSIAASDFDDSLLN